MSSWLKKFVGLTLGCNLLGCARESPPSPSTVASSSISRATSSVTAGPQSMPAPPVAEPSPGSIHTADSPTNAATAPLRGAHARWLTDDAVELGPAGRAAAWQHGAIMITRNNELRALRLGKLSGRAQAAPTPMRPLAPGKDVFDLARGPSVLGSRAYWIAARQLWMAELAEDGAASQPRALAGDAQNGTRVAVPQGFQGAASADQPRCVAYVARSRDDPQTTVAQLVTESAPPLNLTPAGAAATSVSLAYVAGGVVAWSIEGRTGMTPVHAREVRFHRGPQDSANGNSRGSTIELLEDRVVWVGGASQPFSEVIALPSLAGSPRALLATEQDVSHFGMLTLTLPTGRDSQPHWSLYPNGIDPAPVATAQLCGSTVIARAKPQSAQGATPQEVELLSADPTSDVPPLIVAYAQRFFDISLATIAGGALLVAVADERTWATTLRCRER